MDLWWGGSVVRCSKDCGELTASCGFEFNRVCNGIDNL